MIYYDIVNERVWNVKALFIKEQFLIQLMICKYTSILIPKTHIFRITYYFIIKTKTSNLRNRNESQIKLNFHFYLNKIIIIKINAGIWKI